MTRADPHTGDRDPDLDVGRRARAALPGPAHPVYTALRFSVIMVEFWLLPRGAKVVVIRRLLRSVRAVVGSLAALLSFIASDIERAPNRKDGVKTTSDKGGEPQPAPGRP